MAWVIIYILVAIITFLVSASVFRADKLDDVILLSCCSACWPIFLPIMLFIWLTTP